MRIIAFYQDNFYLSTHVFKSSSKDITHSIHKHIDIDDELATFLRSLFNVPESTFSWDKIL